MPRAAKNQRYRQPDDKRDDGDAETHRCGKHGIRPELSHPSEQRTGQENCQKSGDDETGERVLVHGRLRAERIILLSEGEQFAKLFGQV